MYENIFEKNNSALVFNGIVFLTVIYPILINLIVLSIDFNKKPETIYKFRNVDKMVFQNLNLFFYKIYFILFLFHIGRNIRNFEIFSSESNFHFVSYLSIDITIYFENNI